MATTVPMRLILNPEFCILIMNQDVLQLDLTLPNGWKRASYQWPDKVDLLQFPNQWKIVGSV